MTYVEFFDAASVRNILTALMDPPERVVIIGNSSKHMSKYIQRYQNIFAGRYLPVEFVPRSASRSNLENAVEQIEKILDDYGPCVFDITGGDEILNMALGVVYAKRPQDVKFHRITLEKNMVHDCDKDGITIEHNIPELTVEESVHIYGGEVITGDVVSPHTYYYDITDDFLESVAMMWDVYCIDLRKWSRQVNVFEAVVTLGKWSEDGLTVTANRDEVERHLLENDRLYREEQEIIDGLSNSGCITKFEQTPSGKIVLSFRDLQVRRVLSRAGTILEMKVYLTLLEQDMGYTDCLSGVKIDWDGLRHDDEEDYIETDNEIDVLAMRGAVPIFISCKSGYIDANELYKLETVARRFGGPYAKLVLVANGIPHNKYGENIRDRAKQMKIRLIECIQDMDNDQLRVELDHLWEV